MLVFSHSKKNDDGKKFGTKPLIDHLVGVSKKADESYSDVVNFNRLNLRPFLESITLLHDFGKYSSFFQDYLLGRPVDFKLKNHPKIGGHLAFSLFDNDYFKSGLAFFLIRLHHQNLKNIDSILIPDFETEMSDKFLIGKQIPSLLNYQELKDLLPELNHVELKVVSRKSLKNSYIQGFKKECKVENYFLVNYLFSLLIESDKLDASDTSKYKFQSIPSDSVDIRLKKPKYNKTVPLKELNQNELRNYVRSEVVKNLNNPDIIHQRIFTLAAPTGIGKTLTVLDFVLKLREKIERETEHLCQIVYAIPFINIIEQAYSEYKKTLPKTNILAHYQYADIFGSQPDKEKNYNQAQMSWDTWQSAIVITSFVQFFETLIGNRNRLLKKFHHLSNAIVILDEVQTLPLGKLPLIAAAIQLCSKYLNTRFIIMTATKPKLFELAQREIGLNLSDDPHLKPFNLLRNDREVFQCFNRTKIVPILNESVDIDRFSDIFFDLWDGEKSCLIVVNKVKRSIEIFENLKRSIDNDEVKLFYLSTNITPREREIRVNELKSDLKNRTCILISTQVVEAGVDLDFDMGFRDLGPIDSIIQVAGRINRENNADKKNAPLYIIDFDDCSRIYGFNTDFQARKALSQKEEFFEIEYKDLVEPYFDNIANPEKEDFSESREIFSAMKELRYEYPKSRNKKLLTVSDFRIIENSQNAINVFVECSNDEVSYTARKAFQSLLTKKLKKEDFNKNFKKAFHQQIIAVPDYLQLVSELKREEKLSEDIYWIKPETSKYYYNETGFIREDESPNAVNML